MIITNHAYEQAEYRFGMGRGQLKHAAERCLRDRLGDVERVDGFLTLYSGRMKFVFGPCRGKYGFKLITVAKTN